MDIFKTKKAKIKSIQSQLSDKNSNLSLMKRLILMVQLMILGFGKTEKWLLSLQTRVSGLVTQLV